MAGTKTSLVVLAISFLLERGEAFSPRTRFHSERISRFDTPNLGLAASTTSTDSSITGFTNGESKDASAEKNMVVSPAFLEDSTDFEGAIADGESLPAEMITLPRHSHPGVNDVLEKTEAVLKGLHRYSKQVDAKRPLEAIKEAGRANERIFANSYVDLAKIDTFGFDFDYTLVTYTEEILDLIYEMALKRLVMDRQYPLEMLESGLKFDPSFSIRGLAVDRETGWICHLSYTHKVAVAWEGRERVPTARIFLEYRGKRALRPSERKQRIKPLNDIFSMAECCLIADTIQFFKDRGISYCPQNVVTDVSKAIGGTHVSGDFHRIVARNPERYFEPTPHLKGVIQNLKDSGKRLIFVSNSPFWYVDAGMRYVFGKDWRNAWDAVITSKYTQGMDE
jgi:hypothetical protein